MGGGILSKLLRKYPQGIGATPSTMKHQARQFGSNVDKIFTDHSLKQFKRKNNLRINDFSGGNESTLQRLYESLKGKNGQGL